ncbi:unnamed protein product [Somion occarium]|uniref:SAGA-associated factor 11 n=1 Tax=Somion occarium TaxID=3059160 RepID=A0ABP1CP57_9APHY
MPPKRERDEALSELSSRIFSSMLDEIILDVVLQSHQEIARAKAVCPKCHTRCGSVHNSGPTNVTQPTVQGPSSSRPSPRDGETAENSGSYDTGRSTPINGKLDGTIYFECEVCKRQIASNRYAPHLSACLGMGNRRGAARSATTKNKLAADVGRSASPYIASENGYVSDEAKNGVKGKGKSKAKRTDEAEFNLGKKRTGSPSVSPAKKSKKTKANASPSSRVRTEPGTPSNPAPLNYATSLSKVPSRLRESSVMSSTLHERRSSSPESRFSSPERSAATPTSTLSSQSPLLSSLSGGVLATKGRPQKNGKPKTNGTLLPKRPSPPRPPPPPPVVRMPEPDYLMSKEMKLALQRILTAHDFR